MDQVVSGEKLVKDKFQRVISAGFVQRKHIKEPSVHMLEEIQTKTPIENKNIKLFYKVTLITFSSVMTLGG